MKLAAVYMLALLVCLGEQISFAQVRNSGVTFSGIPRLSFETLDYYRGSTNVKLASKSSFDLSLQIRQRTEEMTSRYFKFTFGNLEYEGTSKTTITQDSKFWIGATVGITSNSRSRFIFDTSLNYAQQYFMESVTTKSIQLNRTFIPSLEGKLSVAIYTPSDGRGKIVSSLVPDADISKLRLEFKAATTPPLKFKSQSFSEWTRSFTARLVKGDSIHFFALFYTQQYQQTKDTTYKRDAIGLEFSLSLDHENPKSRSKAGW